jgi:hypothetical protein
VLEVLSQALNKTLSTEEKVSSFSKTYICNIPSYDYASTQMWSFFLQKVYSKEESNWKAK